MAKKTMPTAKAMIHSAEPAHTGAPGIERLVFFSDAVFAIAITLLVLDIRLPVGDTHLTNVQLLTGLLSIWPRYLAYAISFLVIGSAWTSHLRKFHLIRIYDNRLILINLLLLMVVAFIPFPTAILSEYGNRTATIFYALTIVVTGLLSVGMWLYAARAGRLVDPQIGPEKIRQETLRSISIPAIFLVSIALAFWNADAAKYFWLLTAPLLALQSRKSDKR
jgi:uncharacterized membrane protein